MTATPMWKVVQVGTGVAGSPDYMTGYFDQAGGTAQQAANDWRSFLAAGTSSYSTPYRYSNIVSVDLIDPVTGNILAVAPVSVAQLQFTATVDSVPQSTALGINWATGVYIGGRQVKGRTYISRLDAATNDLDGIPSSSTLTGFQTRVTALLSSATSKHVVWSKKNGEWFETISGQPSPKWYVLKSRRD